MNLKSYKEEVKKSKSTDFWATKATELLHWDKGFKEVYNFKFGADQWFSDGMINACYNCIDRHAEKTPNKDAFIFDSNDGTETRVTYKEVLRRVTEISNTLSHLKKGDCVSLYLPMGQEAVFTALACARLGLTHNAVFGGFASDSLQLRLLDSRSKLLVTQDLVKRGEKVIDYLEVVKQAIDKLDIEVLVFDKDASTANREINSKTRLWSQVKGRFDPIPCVSVEAEHPLFYLYTSGSTGKPKGLIHSTGGYLLYAAYTLKTAFDIEASDIFCCTADIGWITGHSYSIYGPTCLGITSVIVEGLPTFPSFYRFYDLVHKYRITQLYTAPTAIRILKKHFETTELDLSKHVLTSLKCLGSVGEPINKEAYRFFSESFGNLDVVDTYWQTETGGFLIAPIKGIKDQKPECACLPMPGIFPIIGDEDGNDLNNAINLHRQELPDDTTDINSTLSNIVRIPDITVSKPIRVPDIQESNPVLDSGILSLVCSEIPQMTLNEISDVVKSKNVLGRIYITQSWPGIARGILNDPDRFFHCYFSTPFYFTGDEGIKDEEGDFWIRGRADDVINVSGHRISTAEVESAACCDPNVAEAAVVSVYHEIKGQSMTLFVVLKKEETEYQTRIQNTISEVIGKFCRPDKVIKTTGIPKTATGKIMRRVLRSLINRTEMGDLSTCINVDSVDSLRTLLTADNTE